MYGNTEKVFGKNCALDCRKAIKIQKEFDDSKIIFSNEYYDTLGIERADGTENKRYRE